jgi:N-acetylmuramic acid 6-phosphate etherase
MVTPERILGIEGGGTKTAWALICDNTVVESGRLPPSNFRLTPQDQFARMLRELPKEPDRVGVFLAGCGTNEDRAALRELVRDIWPKAKIVVGSDRDAGMAACLHDRDGIVVNAGTGSSVTGRTGDRIEKAGGWGHILGDSGGAYFVSIRALRLILREYDLRRGERKFAADILSALALNNFDELVRWAQTADKTEIASLAPVVFSAANDGDGAAQEIINAGATVLAHFTAAVAARLQLEAPEVRVMGGLFEHWRSYVVAFSEVLQENVPKAQIGLIDSAPEIGAAWLAANGSLIVRAATAEIVPDGIALTEEPNPSAANLEKLGTRELVELFLAEEKSVERALRHCVDQLARAIDLAVETIQNGGRVFYVGAGTSGRLGVIDAAEIPPTFGTSPDLVQGIIAGGATALRRSVEGAEDDKRSGALMISERNVGERDLIVGISASGRAPFVLGALERASEIGARRILLTCNPRANAKISVDLEINLPTGPEIVAGSTRLKAGTATKVALNIISTGTMIRLGRVHGNLMIDLQPTNNKLRERALRLVAQLTGCDRTTARSRLEQSDWNVRRALKADSSAES